VEEDYGLLQELGRGTYGNVFSAYKRSETSDYIYAIKIFKSTNNEGFFEELNVMVQAGKHDNILDFL
jgi:serine/threonine protein kinase